MAAQTRFLVSTIFKLEKKPVNIQTCKQQVNAGLFVVLIIRLVKISG